jgi:UDP-glucose 4-epimerase
MTERSRFLVTGGAGYVGSHVVAALRDAGHDVLVFDNLRTGHREAVPAGVTFVEGDLADRALVDTILASGPWAGVLHFAALSLVGESMQHPLRYMEANAGLGFTLIDACIRHGVKRFVFSSTAALFGQTEDALITEATPIVPGSPYGESKHMVERALLWADRIHGLRSACLRYFNAAGADPDGRLGEDHRPETHLIPLVIDAALGRRRRCICSATTIRRPTEPASATISMSRTWPMPIWRHWMRSMIAAWSITSAPGEDIRTWR